MTTTRDAEPHALFEKTGRVGVITLNNPVQLNALSPGLMSGLHGYVEQCNADPGIGAIVITGAGRAFCSGATLGGPRGGARSSPAEQPAGSGTNPLTSLPELFTGSKPIVAAINGPAVGGGLTISLCCDIRIASEKAVLSARFVRVGLTPEFASSFLLPQIVGLATACELVFTARMVGAEEALRIGLVSRVVPHERLMEEALALASEIAFHPAEQLRLSKQLLYANLTNSDLGAVTQGESAALRAVAGSPATVEAARAFVEKRQPVFHPE